LKPAQVCSLVDVCWRTCALKNDFVKLRHKYAALQKLALHTCARMGAKDYYTGMKGMNDILFIDPITITY